MNKAISHKTTGRGKTYNPTDKGAGMTAKGRAEYNKKNGTNLKGLLLLVLGVRLIRVGRLLFVRGWRVW